MKIHILMITICSFDELVKRARIQDMISKDLAIEKAKGLVAMLMQRRRYVKLLRNARENQVFSKPTTSETWLSPSSPTIDNPSTFIQLRRSQNTDNSNNNDLNIKNSKGTHMGVDKGNTIVCFA